MDIRKISDHHHRILRTEEMNTNVDILAGEQLLKGIKEDDTLKQIKKVASLPSIQGNAVLMPDGHQGYGMPIGGVAAFSTGEKGIISPSMVGFDINCGVRVLKTSLTSEDIRGRKEQLANLLFNKIPTGTGKGGILEVTESEMDEILDKGMEWMLENGYAREEDLESCEDGGNLDGDSSKVSDKAKNRGKEQVGSLGSGNHFLEIQEVQEVYDEETAGKFGLEKDQIVIMIHCGSRGLGHQVCKDYTKEMREEFPEIDEKLPDDKLMYAPIKSDLGQNYLKAMNAAANFAYVNRQAITHQIREEIPRIFDEEVNINLLYDVCHNIAKIEPHEVEGSEREVIVHRKGATRAFPAGRPELPEKYSETGQPVLLPGTMGTESYILSGSEESLEKSFGSSPHGSGRTGSRTQGREEHEAGRVKKRLRQEGVEVKARSPKTIEEETPEIYKDVSEVVESAVENNLSSLTCKLKPLVNIKG